MTDNRKAQLITVLFLVIWGAISYYDPTQRETGARETTAQKVDK